jgi:hypothetical protein
MKKYLLMALVAFVIIAGAFMIQKPASKKGESYVNYFISKVEDGNETVIDILDEAITFVGLDKDIQKGLKDFSNDITKGLGKYTTEEANTIFGIYQFTLDTIFDNIKFDLVDDLKIWIHTQNDLDCITFDGDIILTSRLDFMNEFGYDAIFENKETKKNVLNKEWDSYNGYVTMLEIFEKYNTDKLVKNYTNTNTFSCNVGVIKFKKVRI